MQEADGEIITAGMMRRAFVPALVRGKGLRVECAVWDGVDEKGEERKGKDGNVEVDDIGDDIGNDIEGDDDESAGDAGDGDVSMQMDVCMSMDDGRDVVEHLEAQLKAALGEDSGEEMEDFGERLD